MYLPLCYSLDTQVHGSFAPFLNSSSSQMLFPPSSYGPFLISLGLCHIGPLLRGLSRLHFLKEHPWPNFCSFILVNLSLYNSSLSGNILNVCVCVCVCVCARSVHGIFQARILKWVAISSCRELSRPRDQTWVSCLADGFLIIWATWGSLYLHMHYLSNFFGVLVSLGLCYYIPTSRVMTVTDNMC